MGLFNKAATAGTDGDNIVKPEPNGRYLPLDDQTASAWNDKEGPQEPMMTRAEHEQIVEDMQKSFKEDIDWQGHNAKTQALAEAVRFFEGTKDPEKVVSAAKVFYNFLRGAE